VTKPIRGAIIGCGDICRAHFTAYKARGIEVVAVCDLDPELAKRKITENGCPDATIYTDHKELLARSDIDFVTVATPVSAHALLTIAALKAGKHVACEKPSALTLEENLAILEASRAAKKKVIFFSSRMRYGMASLAAQRCRKGDLGRIYRVDVQMARRRGRPGVDIIQHAKWFVDAKRAGGGVIMDMGQYYMDMVFHLTGWPEIEAVSASGFRGFPHELPTGTTYDVEEQCTILARAKGGCTYTFDLSWIGHQDSRNEVTLRGVNGGIRIDAHSKDRPYVFFQDGASPWEWMNTTTDWRDGRDGNEHCYEDFVRSWSDDSVESGTTPEQAVAITRFTLMALKSAELGREVRADELPLPKAASAKT
jgi:predicted dehydrogenase